MEVIAIKKLLLLFLILPFVLTFQSCEKKGEPLGPDLQFFLDPQLYKQYNFQRYNLDSLDNRADGPYYFYEKCIEKNISFAGRNNVFVSITYHNSYTIDTTFLYVDKGKDVYEWADTAEFPDDTREGLRFVLRKALQTYVWLPSILLSKGNNAEYTILPKRFYTVEVDSNFFLNVSVEVFGKNEGFEDVTVPAGTYKAYKVKITFRLEPYFGTQKIETIDVNHYSWVSDDLDWWIKLHRPTAHSKVFGEIYGETEELISAQ